VTAAKAAGKPPSGSSPPWFSRGSRRASETGAGLSHTYLLTAMQHRGESLGPVPSKLVDISIHMITLASSPSTAGGPAGV
jgi:hypothetical protein